MFKGEYSHSVDTKGRIIMPAKFRDALGDAFVVTKGLDHCLFVYTAEEWENIENSYHENKKMDRNSRKFERFFFAGAADCEIDKQGRALIPANLREYAQLDKDVVLAGVLNRIEIWSKELWEGNAYDDYGDMDDIAEYMAGLGVMI